jgi:hypothetical protein
MREQTCAEDEHPSAKSERSFENVFAKIAILVLARKAPASGGIPAYAKATAGRPPGLISCKHLSLDKDAG